VATESTPTPRGRKRSIRAKLLAASTVLLVGSTFLYGYVAFTTARNALLPSIREQLADDAVNVKGGLEEMLTAHYLNVQTWARLGLMREMVVRDLDKTIARFLESVHRDYGVYLAVVALDRDARCVASSDREDIGKDFAGTPLAVRLASVDARFEPSLEWSEPRGAWYLRLVSSIPDPDRPGQVLGTLVAMLDREVLDRIVVSKPGHSQVELRLLDKNKRLLAGRKTELKIHHVEAWQVGRGANPDHFPPGSPPLIQEATDTDGRSLIIAEVPVGNHESLPTPGWHLTASVPRDLALAPVVMVRDRVFATGIGLILFGLAAAAVLANRLTRPIDELTRVAARIARTGDLEPVPEPSSNDEIGELALAFQRMVTGVSAAHDEIVRTSKLAFLGEMAAGMAHEIRTPLGIIRNAAQLIERKMDSTGDREVGEWAVFIREESDRLAKVVTELLEFVKPVPPMKVEADLAALVRRSATMLASEAANRGVVVNVHATPVPVFVACDADQIHQVCLNLLLNALQASSPGGTVDVLVERHDGHVDLAIRDKGRGIPVEIVDRLFEPFTSQRDGGIGLGLAIVRRIVRAHGGDVTARNRDGGGAEFIVSLPVQRPGLPQESHET
jgi:two-component system sensor histidine kinase HydH